MSRRLLALIVVAGSLLAACSSSDSGIDSRRSDESPAPTGVIEMTEASVTETMGATETTGLGGVDVLTGPVVITLGAGAQTVTIGPAGGEIDVVDARGTRFVLDVPADALLADVEITATPVAAFDNLGFDGRGVVFGPDGLYFASDVTLRVTPVEPIPVADQFMFTFADDGTPRGAAFAQADTADMVIILQHFSGYGVGDVSAPQQAAYLARDVASVQAVAESALAAAFNAERQRELDGEPGQDLAPFVDTWKQTMLDQVVPPILAEASSSCAAAVRAFFVVAAFQRQLLLFGRIGDTSLPSLPELYAQSVPICEREAIEACKAAKDPQILFSFWLSASRNSQLQNLPDPYPWLSDQSASEERARQICNPTKTVTVEGPVQFSFNGTTGTATISLTMQLASDDTYSGTADVAFNGAFGMMQTSCTPATWSESIDLSGTLTTNDDTQVLVISTVGEAPRGQPTPMTCTTAGVAIQTSTPVISSSLFAEVQIVMMDGDQAFIAVNNPGTVSGTVTVRLS